MYQFMVTLLSFIAFTTALPSFLTADPRINGDGRIVGGSNAAAGEFPFIVSFRTSANVHFCSGSVISPLWVLTAAHCISGRTTANTVAVAGTNTLNSGGQSRSTRRLIVHSNFNTETFLNDIGVANLATAFTLNSLTAVVGLSTANIGTVSAILSGWGRTAVDGSVPNNLQKLPTNTVTNAQCQQSWGSNVGANQICTFIGTGRGACEGDSGSPLIQTSNRALIGMLSFGLPCAQSVPDVYVRISSYVTWINAAIQS